LLLAVLHGITHVGEPSPADLAKAISNGLGMHEHDGLPAHPHGDPSFTDEEVDYLARKGYHVDRHHGVVYGFTNRPVSPANVATILRQGRHRARYSATGKPG
jgi:hypothetical protein